ncbi:hypothetical protein L1987_46806 [Smallanthus sonchifolius]|uniref:Uncharacterized protein n=1 Tax=Smallanthus sonchifolius TaxID=185202 RepID=A0ACB9G1E5_9ASTR|nr:hypothetical protein L1987_46806 [Smallanthus sonchifolius]
MELALISLEGYNLAMRLGLVNDGNLLKMIHGVAGYEDFGWYRGGAGTPHTAASPSIPSHPPSWWNSFFVAVIDRDTYPDEHRFSIPHGTRQQRHLSFSIPNRGWLEKLMDALRT